MKNYDRKCRDWGKGRAKGKFFRGNLIVWNLKLAILLCTCDLSIFLNRIIYLFIYNNHLFKRRLNISVNHKNLIHNNKSPLKNRSDNPNKQSRYSPYDKTLKRDILLPFNINLIKIDPHSRNLILKLNLLITNNITISSSLI